MGPGAARGRTPLDRAPGPRSRASTEYGTDPSPVAPDQARNAPHHRQLSVELDLARSSAPGSPDPADSAGVLCRELAPAVRPLGARPRAAPPRRGRYRVGTDRDGRRELLAVAERGRLRGVADRD